VMGGIVKGGTKRLGLEGNEIGDDGLAMIAKWIKGGAEGPSVCEALDLSNNSIHVRSIIHPHSHSHSHSHSPSPFP
jgi:hypothetical protein